MLKIDKLRQQRTRFEQAISDLRDCLKDFERPINLMMAGNKRTLEEMSIAECIQTANLLIEMHEVIESE